MKERPSFRRIFRLPGQRGRVRLDVDEELAFHVDMRERDLIEEGWTAAEARDEAVRQFGDVNEVRRACRRIGFRREGEVRISDSWDRFRQDVRFAVRQSIRMPVVSALAVATLAIGIGAATVVYTVVDAVVLGAAPFEDADRLLALAEQTPSGDRFSMSEPNFLDWRSRQRSFTDIAAFTMGDRTLTGVGVAERVSGLRVTHSLMSVLSLTPVLGRQFRPEEDEPGGETRVAILSEGFWERQFGSSADVVGERLTLDGEPFEVVGVAPSDRAFPGVDVFTPLVPDPAADRSNHMIEGVGRLAPGATIASAQDDIADIARALSVEYPENSGWSGLATSLRDARVPESTRATGTFLLGAVSLILLMACGSVSNMLVARATTRRREMGLRAALGAGRRRIIRQLVTESALLGFAGGLAGIALAMWGLPFVQALGPGDLVRLGHATVDARVLGIATALSAMCVILFGLLPALFVTRGSLFESLRDGQGSSAGPSRGFRDGLVVAQFALAMMVVTGAGLTVRSFEQLSNIDLGLEPEGALQFNVSVPDGAFSGPERTTFLNLLQLALGGLPGVEAVGMTMSSPFSPLTASNHVASVDDMPDRQEDFLPVSWRAVTGGFFGAVGLETISGRVFGPQDRMPEGEEPPDDWEPGVVLDALLARALWGRLDVVGEGVVWGDPEGTRMRVIGVVEAARDEWIEVLPRPRIYLHYDLFPWPEPSLIVRAGVDPASLVPAIRSIVSELDPDVPVTQMRTLPEVVREAVAWPRFTMQVLSAFGLVALVLAAIGVYGVTSFNVARRSREIGIRLALGAHPQRVLRGVLASGMRLAVLGIVVGVLASLELGRFVEALLYETAPRDPMTYVLVPLGLGLVALVATWVPARRATRVDPKEALSSE